MQFAEVLKRLRTASGLSLRGLARKAGINHMAVWKYEHGKNRPRAVSVRALSRALVLPTGLLEWYAFVQQPKKNKRLFRQMERMMHSQFKLFEELIARETKKKS